MQLNLQINILPFGIKFWKKQPLRLLIVRHGQTVANVDPNQNKVFADSKIPLTDLGEEQALKTANFIAKYYAKNGIQNRVRMWCSPYNRAQVTGDIILGHLQNKMPQLGIDRRYDFRLREQEFGYTDGMENAEIQEKFPMAFNMYDKLESQGARFYARKYGGESWADVADRTQGWIGTMQRDADKYGIQDVVVVAHGVTNRALTMTYCHHDHFNPSWFESERNPKNCSVRLLDGSGPDGDKGYIFIP
jgi:2,3-bisphosphoglycerate-dependent phosphoglycerate mutase